MWGRTKDPFDQVTNTINTHNDCEDLSPGVAPSVSRFKKMDKENFEPESPLQNSKKADKPSPNLFEDSHEMQKPDICTKKKPIKHRDKTTKNSTKATKKETNNDHPPESLGLDLTDIANDDFYIESGEDEKSQQLRTNFCHTIKSSEKEIINSSNLSTSSGIIFCTPGAEKKPDNFSGKTESYDNYVTSRRQRSTRHSRSFKYDRTSNNFNVPHRSNFEDLTNGTLSCSTPKSASHIDSSNCRITFSDFDTSTAISGPEKGFANTTHLISESKLNESEPSYTQEVCDEGLNNRYSLCNKISPSLNISLADSFHCDSKQAESKVLRLCKQRVPIAFTDCISERMMSDCVKIGEGVYGEVFTSVSEGKQIALKVIPIEGGVLVNDCPQKRFDEILPEIVIARELSDLASGDHNRSSNFCQVNRVSCVKGAFPLPLLQQWDEYAQRKKSENDRPDFFTDEQLFIVFEFAHGGKALECFKFQSQTEVFSVMRQIVFALAVAEKELEFEHRDLHIGNVLVKNCDDETITFYLDDSVFEFRTEGVIATIIDFTISRLKKDECAVFCDIASDEGLFEGSGDIQFDVYREMRAKNGNNWEDFHPESNILWTSYLCSKLLSANKVKNARRAERHLKQHLHRLDQEIPEYSSCAELAFTIELWAE